jgi:cysteine desulfurase/selenocysteine lyase
MNATRRELLQVMGFAPLLPSWPSPEAFAKETRRADSHRIRDYFSQLSTTHNGHPLVYLDSAATTLRPSPVLDAIRKFYETQNANPGREIHFLAATAADEFDSARARIARFINAADPLEIIWTRGTTEALNLIASAWGGPQLRAGDELILTVAEHASSMLPWQIGAAKARATIRYLEVDENGNLKLQNLDNLLSKRTKLVCFTYVSNVLGTINSAKELCHRASEAGARVVIDAAQAVPHFPIDVQELGCDFAAFSGHKMLGPMGVGVLYARREVMEEMQVYQSGSNMAHARSLTDWHYSPGALRFGAGTPNVADAVGLAAAADWLTMFDRGKLWSSEQQLTRYALARLQQVRDLRVLGPLVAEQRTSIFSFVIDGVAASTIAHHLDGVGICIRAGDLASMPLLQRFGLESAARASLYLYSTEAEVNRLADALEQLESKKNT